MKYACLFDVSTTTNSIGRGHDCPLQFACEFMEIESIGSKSNKKFELAFIPDEPVMPAAMMQVKYDEDFKARSIDLSIGLNKVYNILKRVSDTRMYVIGYNIEYDIKYLNNAFERVLGYDPIAFDKDIIIDLMILSQKTIDIDKINRYSMAEVYTYFDSENPGAYYDKRYYMFAKNMTGSLFDNEISKYILQKIIEISKIKSWEEIIELQKTRDILKIVPFGKYRGQLIDDVFMNDRQYLAWWLATNAKSNKMPDFKYTLETRYFNDIELSADNS